MNLKSVASRLRRGELHYALGRFKTVRASYSGLQRLRGVVARAPAADVAGLGCGKRGDRATAVRSRE
jgi:hypothetical protein